MRSNVNNDIIDNNNKNYRGEDNGGTDTELLAGGKISAVGGSGNSIRQQSENSRKLEDFLRDNQETQGVHRQRTAGDSGWAHTSGQRGSGFEISRGESFLRSIRGIELSSIDTVGRVLSEKLQGKFKNTVLKDENGKILSLYHFTDLEFEVFADGDIGFHFGTLDAANNRRNDPYRKKRGNAIVFKEAYINIQNPILIDGDRGVWDAFSVAYFLLDLNIFSRNEIEQLKNLEGFHRGSYNSDASIKLRELIKEKGYDGIIYTNGVEADISVIAFDADQIITVAENGVLKGNSGVTESDVSSESGEDNAQNPVLQSGANSENTSENGVDIYKSQSQRTWLWHNNLCGSYRN